MGKRAAEMNAANREAERLLNKPAKKKEKVEEEVKEEDEQQQQQQQQQRGAGTFSEMITAIAQLIGRWLFSTRFVGLACFIFGLVGSYFHIFDFMTVHFNVSPYACCPTILFGLALVYMYFDDPQLQHAARNSSILLFVDVACICGVFAAWIIDEQVEKAAKHMVLKYQPEDFAYLSIACAALSFGVSAMDYRMDESIKNVLFRALVYATPLWLFSIYNLLPFPEVPFHTVLLCSFTLAVGIVDFFVTLLHSHIPAFTNAFPAHNLGCIVEAFAMVALTTYFTSLRANLFSDWWFSFSWMVNAGPTLTVLTLLCHFLYWAYEKIFGAGPHNAQYTRVTGACLVATLVYAFGWNGLVNGEFLGASLDMVLIAFNNVKKAFGL